MQVLRALNTTRNEEMSLGKVSQLPRKNATRQVLYQALPLRDGKTGFSDSMSGTS